MGELGEVKVRVFGPVERIKKCEDSKGDVG